MSLDFVNSSTSERILDMMSLCHSHQVGREIALEFGCFQLPWIKCFVFSANNAFNSSINSIYLVKFSLIGCKSQSGTSPMVISSFSSSSCSFSTVACSLSSVTSPWFCNFNYISLWTLVGLTSELVAVVAHDQTSSGGSWFCSDLITNTS